MINIRKFLAAESTPTILASIFLLLVGLSLWLLLRNNKPSTAVSTEMSTKVSTAVSSTTEYKVIHETGLYSAANVSADQLTVLQVGTILKPADNSSSLQCETFTEESITITVCKVTTKSNLTGWVLKKWIQKK